MLVWFRNTCMSFGSYAVRSTSFQRMMYRQRKTIYIALGHTFAHHLMCMPESKSPTSSPSAAWLGEGMALVTLRPPWRCQKHVVSTYDEPTTHDNLHADCAVWSFLRAVNLIQWMPYEPLACSGTRKRALSRPLLCLGFFATRTSCSQ